MKIAAFFRKVPAGNILIPMFISAFFNTVSPGLFNIGGTTQAILSGESLNFLIGLACFCSGLLLDFKTLAEVFKKQGVILLVKIILASLLGFLFVKLIGPDGFIGMSCVSFIVAMFACNPAIYLAIMGRLGTEKDVAAFGLIGLVSLPVLPMILFSMLSTKATINYMPIFSTLIPIVIGMILGNLDPEVRTFFSPLLGRIMPFMGWALGASINLMDAFHSGFSGIVLVILFYVLLIPPLYLLEKKVLKTDGISAIAVTVMPGLAISYPAMLGKTFPGLAPYAASAAAQITFAVVITNILTPVIARKVAHMSKPGNLQSEEQVAG